MQALFTASAGTLASNSAEKLAVMHQQASEGFPVALEISCAHWLGSPQMGHLEGLIANELFVMVCAYKMC